MNFCVTAFYRFAELPVESLPGVKEELQQFAKSHEILGLVLIGSEGVNGTVAGPEAGIGAFKERLRQIPGLAEIEFKDSESEHKPFRRFKVDIREEIVTLKQKVDVPVHGDPSHLSPEEWDRELLSGEDHVVIDVRNDYEVNIGKFRGAVDPQLKKFSEFPKFLDEQKIPVEKKVLMYCTGGIRCEKAYHEMRRRGYDKVFQLDGGILKYLETRPNQTFEGECFIFDHRVALDQELKPTKRYYLCPHCGNPGDQHISCVECGTPAVVCTSCMVQEERKSCSKNCAHHAKRKAEKRAATALYPA